MESNKSTTSEIGKALLKVMDAKTMVAAAKAQARM